MSTERKQSTGSKQFTGSDLLSLGQKAPALHHVLITQTETPFGIHVREISTAERDFLDSLLTGAKSDETRAVIVACSLANPDGTPMYPMVKDEDGKPKFAPDVIPGIRNLPARTSEILFRISCRVNGIGAMAEVDASGK